MASHDTCLSLCFVITLIAMSQVNKYNVTQPREPRNTNSCQEIKYKQVSERLENFDCECLNPQLM